MPVLSWALNCCYVDDGDLRDGDDDGDGDDVDDDFGDDDDSDGHWAMGFELSRSWAEKLQRVNSSAWLNLPPSSLCHTVYTKFS